MKEEFKVYHDNNNYLISNRGRVYSTHRSGRFLKPKIDKDGYLEVGLSQEGKVTYKRVHRLVAETFIPNPLNLPLINHKDEVKSNNVFTNLEWCNHYYNTTYSLNVDYEVIKKIPELYIQGNDYKEIKEQLGLSYRQDYIGEILSGNKHSNITGITKDIRDRQRSKEYSGSKPTETIYKILEDYFIAGLSQTLLISKYSMSAASISRICNGVRYKEEFKKFMEDNAWLKRKP